MPPSATDEKKWERALVAARSVMGGDGVEPDSPEYPGKQAIRQVQHRLTPDEVRQIGEQYQTGLSIRVLANTWHINRETVRFALKRAGVPTRKVELTEQQLAEAHRLRLEGWSLNKLGQHFSVDPKTMKRRLSLDEEQHASPTAG